MIIEFLKDVRCFKAGEVLTLDTNPLILAGDQGSGKSTLLELIANFPTSSLRIQIPNAAKITGIDGYTPLSHDYEKGNVRGGAAFGMGGIDDIGVEAMMLRASHGQAMNLATRYLFDKLAELGEKRGMLVLDEPDSGLSISSAVLLGAMLNRVASKGHLVVAALHNYNAMQMAIDAVYDVEQRKFVKPKEYESRMIKKALHLLYPEPKK